MRKAEYDFLTWVSFPSSAKLISDEMNRVMWPQPVEVPVVPGREVTIECYAKQKGVTYAEWFSCFSVAGYLEDEKRWAELFRITLPLGDFDWQRFTLKRTIPSNVHKIIPNVWGVRRGLLGSTTSKSTKTTCSYTATTSATGTLT